MSSIIGPEEPPLMYRTSSRCTTGGCVEVAPLPDGSVVVRSTKDLDREPLVFDRQEWADFVAGVKDGDFDFSEGWDERHA